jgi:hypothetical protein
MNLRNVYIFSLGLALMLVSISACKTTPSGDSQAPASSPASSLGTITGVALVPGGGPVQEYVLHLLIVQEQTASTGGGLVDTQIDAIPEGSGAFLFENIQPGLYSVNSWDPSTNMPLIVIIDNTVLVFELAAGQTVDLGTISFTGW